MKVVASSWYGNIGIVKTKSPYMGTRFHIGTGKGLNRNEDEQWIAQWGLTFNPDDPFFQHYGVPDNDKNGKVNSGE